MEFQPFTNRDYPLLSTSSGSSHRSSTCRYCEGNSLRKLFLKHSHYVFLAGLIEISQFKEQSIFNAVPIVPRMRIVMRWLGLWFSQEFDCFSAHPSANSCLSTPENKIKNRTRRDRHVLLLIKSTWSLYKLILPTLIYTHRTRNAISSGDSSTVLHYLWIHALTSILLLFYVILHSGVFMHACTFVLNLGII